jgi:hypothetical protein
MKKGSVRKMKLMTKTSVCLYSVITALISGCSVYVGPGGVAVAPEPVVVVYPDYYTWDGYEYVGIHGGQYFYLGAGGAWVVADPVVLERFHGWERFHADWRRTAVRFVPGQHIEHRGPDAVHREVEHREIDHKAPPPQIKKAPGPQEKKAAPSEKKKEP